jgi:hypothetical protein
MAETPGIWKPDVDAFKREDGLWQFGRTEFCEFRFDYNAGEHVVFGGPSTKGKTRLAFNLLRYCATQDLPAYVAVSKPDDKESANQGAMLGYRRVGEWPPPKRVKEIFPEYRPNGYLVWPKLGNAQTDAATLAKITRDLINETYANGTKKKHAILVMDDTMVKAKVLGLDGEMVTILAMAGAMGVGIWVFVQKPTDSGRTTLWAYENATHFFLTKGGDDRSVQRYIEIAGEQGPIIRRVMPTLKPYEFLYFQRYEGWLCVVSKGE